MTLNEHFMIQLHDLHYFDLNILLYGAVQRKEVSDLLLGYKILYF